MRLQKKFSFIREEEGELNPHEPKKRTKESGRAEGIGKYKDGKSLPRGYIIGVRKLAYWRKDLGGVFVTGTGFLRLKCFSTTRGCPTAIKNMLLDQGVFESGRWKEDSIV